MKGNIKRCAWANHELEKIYHDEVWGVPTHDDRQMFKFLVLEGAQAGLSWLTILKKEKAYEEVFFDFDIDKVSEMSDADLDMILTSDTEVVKNRLKIYSVRNNAIAFKHIQDEFGSFSTYIWGYTDNKVIDNRNIKSMDDMPAYTELSEKISKDLKKRGFNFVGPTIVYSFLQAVGIVNDHFEDCFVRNLSPDEEE